MSSGPPQPTRDPRRRWYEWGYQDGLSGDPPSRNRGIESKLAKAYSTGYQAGYAAKNRGPYR